MGGVTHFLRQLWPDSLFWRVVVVFLVFSAIASLLLLTGTESSSNSPGITTP
jgi:hypothetical protein